MPDEKDTQPSIVDLIGSSVGATEDDGTTPIAAPEVGPVDGDPEPAPGGDGEPADGAPPADAKPADGEPAPDPEKPANPDPAADEKAKHEKAVEDEIKSLGLTNAKSQERFRTLANEAAEGRQLKTQLDELKTVNDQQNQIFEQLDNQGVSGEQFGLMVAIAGDVNSGDPVRQKRAYDQLMVQVVELAKGLGIEAPGFDPIAAHADLAKEVEEGLLDRARAAEIAHSRQTAKLATQHQQTTTQQAQYAAEVKAGSQSLDQLEVQLKARDPQYNEKRKILEPTLRAAFAHIPPSQWAGEFAKAYGMLNLPAPAAAPPQQRRPDPNANGRPNGSAGTVAPKSAADAVFLALGMNPDA